MPKTPVLNMEDMDPDEINTFMHDMKHTVPGGKYLRNEQWVDCNGNAYVDPNKGKKVSPPANQSAPPVDTGLSIDLDKMTKEQLLALPEGQAITGADRMSQPDLLRAITELRNK